MTANSVVVSGAQIEAKLTRVSAAVIFRDDGREYLLAQRPPGKVYAGYWEFPGGKVEAGESFAQALVRELQEELGITVTAMTPWITRHFVYPHARVEIQLFRVTAWTGALHPHEHTEMAWLATRGMAGAMVGNKDLDQMPVSPVLPANTPILRALALPPVYAVTNAGAVGVNAELARLQRARPLLVQVREKSLAAEQRLAFGRDVVALVHGYGGHVLWNGSVDEALAVGADGVQLTSNTLMACAQRPELPLVFASCHTMAEINQASALGLDAVVLGSVNSTPSHPDQVPLGWERFTQMIEGCALPVYAIGGMSADDVVTAQAAGAQGVAMLRGW